MKWANIKNIILGFLIIINIVMLAYTGISSWRQNAIPQKVIDASIEVLKNEGFRCSEDIFPSSYYNLPSLDVTFYSASDLSELFFGKQLAFRTVNNTLVAKQDDETLTVSSNYFIYETKNTPDETFSYSQIRSKLKKLGIDMSGSVYNETDGYFYKMYKKTNLFNMYIEAKLDKDGNICYVSAQWPKETTSKGNSKLSFTQKLMKIKEAFPQGGEIKNIELGYSLSLAGGNKYVFEPAWRILVDDELKILK